MADDGDVCPSGLGLPPSRPSGQSHPGDSIRESAENTDTATSEAGSRRRKEVICWMLENVIVAISSNKLEHRKVAIQLKNRDLYQVDYHSFIAASFHSSMLVKF